MKFENLKSIDGTQKHQQQKQKTWQWLLSSVVGLFLKNRTGRKTLNVEAQRDVCVVFMFDRFFFILCLFREKM